MDTIYTVEMTARQAELILQCLSEGVREYRERGKKVEGTGFDVLAYQYSQQAFSYELIRRSLFTNAQVRKVA